MSDEGRQIYRKGHPRIVAQRHGGTGAGAAWSRDQADLGPCRHSTWLVGAEGLRAQQPELRPVIFGESNARSGSVEDDRFHPGAESESRAGYRTTGWTPRRASRAAPRPVQPPFQSAIHEVDPSQLHPSQLEPMTVTRSGRASLPPSRNTRQPAGQEPRLPETRYTKKVA